MACVGRRDRAQLRVVKIDQIPDVGAVEVAGMESECHRTVSYFERKPLEASNVDEGYDRAMTYRITGIDPAPYRHLHGLSDDELASQGVVRMIVDSPSFPCRVSLTDRAFGEKVLLLNHVSHDVANPYRASHAIFVAEGAEDATEYVDEVPPVFETRLLSLRGFDAEGMMADALLTQPGEADAGIRKLFENPAITTIHAHNATRGCFAAKIERN
jgi:hypothetical protein